MLPPISVSNCVPYISCSMGDEQIDSIAVTHIAGVKLSSVIGINLSSCIRFASKAKAWWWFTPRGRVWTHGRPLTGTPRRIVLLNPA